jgi:hypothetical protein
MKHSNECFGGGAIAVWADFNRFIRFRRTVGVNNLP